MWIKICGTTNLDDALVAVQSGADAVGFVFAESKRKVTSEQVADIVRKLPGTVEKVGVFTTDDPFEVEHWVACCGLTAAQLHRPFDSEMVRSLSAEFGGQLKIIQVVAFAAEIPGEPDQGAADDRFAQELVAALAEPAVWAVLLDTQKGNASGGTGEAFDWDRAAKIVEQVWPKDSACHLILAGGLRPENVATAVARLRPWGVDVVTGVEASAGRKDADKVGAFVATARQAAMQERV